MTLFNAAKLHRVFALGSAYASKDGTLPALCGVHVWADGTHLWVESTNRFALVRAKALFESEPFDTFAPNEVVKRVLALAKTPKRAEKLRELSITHTDGITEVTGDGAMVSWADEKMDFPALGKLIGPAFDREEAGHVQLNPEYFAALKPFGSLVINTHPSKPTLVIVKDKFDDADGVVLIMPMRLPDGYKPSTADEWSAA